ncbi:3-phosphoserine/phosphohydroxythreonine transaminase [Enterobacteriaceae endosymbiont of Donacia versicolorea]|uniref:3-phosphoserine/phosphohydroxythreonine transaminase n=1 Tax=Enterobacteriaceae endosymbiont of Donacia versicolorea TaxID=2675788 RepID=UPI0014490351|nr:3-phosphoserine/phosphohydroxythreonine transaminase [Enterobacteriaceae endosymbiont of Donacia versicolorea]QJC32148.1 3-phosphoserine/phosphohydroxythreonine transaminase [Enterobacteriaceae endosymbiont of Donacia versicolorea]
MKKIFNFSPGPASLPYEVLKKAQNEFTNWHNLNISVMEISHRNNEFIKLMKDIKNNLRELMNIPFEYEILFCQGGARTQFSAIPMNLLYYDETADYANIGHWSNQAIKEAKKYCKPNIINPVRKKNGIYYIEKIENWNLNDNTKYIHYCPNETIEGIAINEEPKLKNKIVVADLSSSILTKEINIKNYGMIYASVQKNIGPAGLTIIIIKKDLIINDIKKKRKELPSVLDYQIILKYNSMFNTPPTFSLYLSGLVLKWLKKKGGVKYIGKINKKKAELLYSTIDSSDFYINKISNNNRSITNIVFHLKNPKKENLFLKKAQENGLMYLKGHKMIGGIRASIYNAMPIEGVKKLINFMNDFEKSYL